MRILDVITENQAHPLESVRTGRGNLAPLSRNNHAPNQVVALKQELARHRLVTARNAAGRTLGGMAWTGDQSEEWTTELDNAIMAWKASINLQVQPDDPRRPLEATSPTLRAQDVEFLLNSDLSSQGLLQANGQDVAQRRVATQGPLEGLNYEQTIPGTVDDAVDTASMIEAVGWSAWWRIATEIQDSKFSTDGESWLLTTPPREVADDVLPVYRRFFEQRAMQFADELWLTNVNRVAGREVATYADGTTQPIAYTEFIAPTAAQLFEYYSTMATRLWEKDRLLNAERAEDEETARNNPVTGETLAGTDITAMANALKAAFENELLAAFPGGRRFSNDLEQIRAQMARLRTAADWENLSAEYTRIANGDILHEDLYSELSQEEYMEIVQSRLLAIRRIAPQLMHGSINFGEEQEIEVEYDGTTYTVTRTRPTGNFNPTDYSGYDAIVIDGILRAAIELTGGTVPDLDVPATDEAIEFVKPIFINTINQTYPEMVAFYVRAEPFDEASVDLGGARLRGIIDDAARLGNDEVILTQYITDEIANDREWLVGTDDTEAGANIYFDERYRSEGLSNREFEVIDADEEVVLNANAEEILENLRSTDPAVRQSAVQALIEANDPQQYEDIYAVAARSGNPLDLDENLGGGVDEIRDFVMANSRTADTPIINLARTYTIPIAAPIAMAMLFREAITTGLIAGTDEDLMDALVSNIRTREDYMSVDTRYRALPNVDDSLIDDIAGEQLLSQFGYGWYGQLARVIGDEASLDAIRVELDSRITDALNDLERSPSADNINRLSRLTDSRTLRQNEDQLELVLERLNGVYEDFNDTETPESVLLRNLIDTLQEAYDNL